MATKDLISTDRNKVRELFQKSKADVSKDFQILKDWFVLQKHLPEVPTDNVLECVLFNCKFSIEKAKKHLDMYYTVRTFIPEIYKYNPCSSSMEPIFKIIYGVAMPKLTASMERIVILKYKDSSDIDVDMPGILSYFLHGLLEVRLHEDLCIGDIWILDYTHLSMKVLTTITPLILKQILFIVEKVMSNRVKAVFLYNLPSYAQSLLNMIKVLLKNHKLGKRLHVVKTVQEITTMIPLELLPKDYGGNEKSFDELEVLWKLKFLEYKDRFDLLEKLKVNEELRPDPLKNDEFLGYYGNFKKLDVD